MNYNTKAEELILDLKTMNNTKANGLKNANFRESLFLVLFVVLKFGKQLYTA